MADKEGLRKCGRDSATNNCKQELLLMMCSLYLLAMECSFLLIDQAYRIFRRRILARCGKEKSAKVQNGAISMEQLY